ncbi:MAG: CDP-glucose 4,6-dehydratase [Candidatus Omnitrophota bacterium]|nr:CDP-glucose 4,6-dehydratase [Candidatus Omnitrophota bacterium]
MSRLKNKADLKNAYKGKTVLVTGDTGFKGSWLSVWLNLLGAKVIGYSSYLPSNPCLFSVCRINKFIEHIKGDVRDYDFLKKVFVKHRPDFVFHLAAQPIVNKAYLDPKTTFETNVLGTVNVLECMRHMQTKIVGVMITSDKCYKNMEWEWGYRETDELGGNDPYGTSKACAELVCHSYVKSFFSRPYNNCKMVTARAGNVIGGGDWAADRLVPDCVRAWSADRQVLIRNPKATRPWQHVLEPLSGYLWLGARVCESNKLCGESFNFGPSHEMGKSVRELIKLFSGYFGGNNKWKYLSEKKISRESMFLKVSSDKALRLLGWHAILSFPDTIKMAAEWYEKYYKDKSKSMLDFTAQQIDYYVSEARTHNLNWAKD